MLLFALCWLTLPAVFAPIERALLGAICVVPRVAAHCFGAPVQAAERAHLGGPVELLSRIGDHDLRAPLTLRETGLVPLHCAVIATGKTGGGGQVAELLLDHSYAELAGCSELVTKGDALLGTLAVRGRGPALLDRPDDPARVLLLNHSAARPQYAAMATADGGRMRFVVRAAASVDPAPLRVDLWDDPYRAARIETAGGAVFTEALPELPGVPPAGLRLGRSRIWGYPGATGGAPVLLGVFVDPGVEARALSHVVVWRAAAAIAPVNRGNGLAGLHGIQRLAAVLHDLPGASKGRHLLVVDGTAAANAAVVHADRLLGTAHGLNFGAALMTSFAASRQRWSLLLLPDDQDAAPRELTAVVVHGADQVVWLRWRGGLQERLPPGQLFTGSNGRHCPAGLHIGRAGPHPTELDIMEVTVAAPAGPLAVEVLDGGGP